MGNDLLRDRTEIKFLLPEPQGRRILDRLRTVRGPGFERQEGWVTTVYFDRPDLLLSRRAIASPGANLKVRLREYRSGPAGLPSPAVWVEVKERDGRRSRKLRFPLEKRRVREFLAGALDPGVLLSRSESATREALEAVRRIGEIAPGRLVPVGAVAYYRESVQDRGREARLTVDRKITYHLGPLDLSDGALDREAAWEEPGTVAELKHRGEEPPRWCASLLGDAAPADYSKFLVLSQLSGSEASVA